MTACRRAIEALEALESVYRDVESIEYLMDAVCCVHYLPVCHKWTYSYPVSAGGQDLAGPEMLTNRSY